MTSQPPLLPLSASLPGALFIFSGMTTSPLPSPLCCIMTEPGKGAQFR